MRGADVRDGDTVDLHLEHWLEVAGMPGGHAIMSEAFYPLARLWFSIFLFHIFGPDAPTNRCRESGRATAVASSDALDRPAL